MQERTLKSLDSLDMRIIERAREHEEGIAIYKLLEFPEFADVPPNTVRYRIDSLAVAGEIRVAHRRKYAFVYPSEP
jgi:hypothetical protein